MIWMRNAGAFILFLVVVTIVVVNLPTCESEAHAQKKTEMEKKAQDVLDGKSETGDLVPMVAQPMELDAEEKEKQWDLPQVVLEQDRPVWYEWIVWIVLLSVAGLAIVFLLVNFFRRWRKGRGTTARVSVEKTVCPACKKAVESATFLQLPRVALQRRVFNFGSWQVIRPEEHEQQTIEVCSICFEYGLLKIRAYREKVMEDRAKDRRMEFDRLVDFQKGLLDDIYKARNPGNGDS